MSLLLVNDYKNRSRRRSKKKYLPLYNTLNTHNIKKNKLDYINYSFEK